jgi:uncharacterized protein YbbC (DUF1343 family)
MVSIGIDEFLKSSFEVGNFALVAHMASVNADYEYSWDLLNRKYPGKMKKIFSPQHGLMGTEQANMIETEDSIDKNLGIPVISLYADKRKPKAESLSGIDTIIIDLQDVGTRFYTYIYTMSLTMEAAGELGIKVIVLDRPNPIGLTSVYGNINRFKSFVGWHPIPVQHGMTIGELAKMFNKEHDLSCDLEVIPVKGLERKHTFFDGLWGWVYPSPNMPTAETAVVYPGGCLLEGTNISEGRGTTKPFELVGAPFIDEKKFASELQSENLPGVIFRPISFRPTFDKFADETCNGVSLQVTNKETFNGYLTFLSILKVIINLYPDQFSWSPPPYEYEFKELPIDILIADKELRSMIEKNEDIEKIDEYCKSSLKPFLPVREKYLIY